MLLVAGMLLMACDVAAAGSRLDEPQPASLESATGASTAVPAAQSPPFVEEQGPAGSPGQQSPAAADEPDVEGPATDVEGGAGSEVTAADAFVDSVGVAGHLSYLDTEYGDQDKVVKALTEAGIRHFRDGLRGYDREAVRNATQRLVDAGIKVTYVPDGRPAAKDPTGYASEVVEILKQSPYREAVSMVTGLNEPDLFIERSDWAEVTRRFQEALYKAMKADPATKDIPVCGPPLGHGFNQESRDQLGDLSKWVDCGDEHLYAGGRAPEQRLADVPDRDQPDKTWGDKPFIVTESGYHTALKDTSGQSPTSEKAQAVYLPRMYLSFFDAGIPRTFKYELLDLQADPGQRSRKLNWGLVRADGTPKPAYVAVKNLLALFDDPGVSFEPKPLSVQVNGADDSLRQMVFQRRDGEHLVALWQDASVWDPKTLEDLDVPAKPVSVEVGDGKQITAVHVPGESAEPVAQPMASTADLRIGASVTVLRIE